MWVSRSAPRALLLATTAASGGDLDALEVATARVRSAFAEATRDVGASAPKLLLSGAPLFAVDSRDQIKSEAVHLATVGGIVMGGLLLLAFASPRALVIALLPVATGVVAGTAAVSLVFGAVHGLTMGFGSTLIGDGRLRHLLPDPSPWRQRAGHRLAALARHPLPTVRLGLLTSVAASRRWCSRLRAWPSSACSRLRA
ncbi:MAG: hypothetical protein WKG52_05675 [Variovorax sp.]